MNDLTFARGVTGKKEWLLRPGKKKKNPFQFNVYNKIKQEWSTKVCKLVTKVGFKECESAYFHYLVVERTLKRDPSNICSSAVKFIEDGLQEAGVIPNDGWRNVLGIHPYWIHDPNVCSNSYLSQPSEAGAVFLLMANEPLSKNAVVSYYNDWKLNANDSQQVDNQG